MSIIVIPHDLWMRHSCYPAYTNYIQDIPTLTGHERLYTYELGSIHSKIFQPCANHANITEQMSFCNCGMRFTSPKVKINV